MALTPQNNDAFFREVDDELRRSELDRFGRRWGLWILAGVLVVLAAFGGWLFWQHERTVQAEKSGVALDQALSAIAQNQVMKAKPALARLASASQPGYRAAAKLGLAGLALQEGKTKEAITGFKAVADDGALAQPYRDLALIRRVAAEFDTLPPNDVIARLTPLAVPGGPWFGSASEMIAAAQLKLNRPDRAGPIFVAIAKDEQVPGTLRTRATQIATAMGLDVVLPGANGMGGE